MLTALRETPPYEKLEALAARLEQGMTAALTTTDLDFCINRVGSMMTLFFTNGPVLDWETASQSDTERFSKYFWGLIDRGVYMPCSQFEALFISESHSIEDIDTTIAAIADIANSI